MENNNLKWDELESKILNPEDKIAEQEKVEENTEEEKMEQTEIKNSNNKIKKFLPFIIVGIILLIFVIFSTIFAIININNENIISGIKIQGIEVSGLSKEEAKQKLNLLYNEKKEKDILLKYEDYDATINPELLEVNYDIDKAVEEAVSIGKNSNIFVNNYNILFSLIGKKNINIDMTINEEESIKIIKDIGTNIPGAVTEVEYYVENDKLIITKGKEGLSIDTENLLNKIKDILQNSIITQEYIDIPVVNKIPDEIDIEKIYADVHKEAKDAYYTTDPFEIFPEVIGVDFDIEEAKKILLEDKEQYEIPLKITNPQKTTSQIGTEAFPDLLGTHTTRYDASLTDRSTNLRLACQKINDVVVLPGDTFSYNKTLGERTAAAGYKNAKVYENGQVVDGIGGGICQISTTLYNAVLKANLEVTERRNHQFVTSYTPAGLDATVVYGMTDFKFKNTRNYAIKIKASCSNGIATISIYGIKQENEYSVSFDVRTISTIPYTVKYVEDSTLAKGTEKVSQVGANGAITETYIIKSLNGKVVSRQLLSRDTYSAMQRIILRGTKGTTTTPSTNNNQNSGTNNNNPNSGTSGSGSGTQSNPSTSDEQKPDVNNNEVVDTPQNPNVNENKDNANNIVEETDL